ncbi:MAG: hypothetical protein EBT12_00290 [Marivivens sp.]|nr:hypothetical protein [Marivivens sp.]
MDDINNHGKDKRTGVGIPFLMFAAMLCLAVCILITATGCNTVAGLAADVEAAARGTQDYLADGVDSRRPTTQPVYHE